MLYLPHLKVELQQFKGRKENKFTEKGEKIWLIEKKSVTLHIVLWLILKA